MINQTPDNFISRVETNFDSVKPYTMRDLIGAWANHVEDQFTSTVNNLYAQSTNSSISKKEHEDLSRKASEERNSKLPKRDGLTGAYDRKELFNLIGIAKALGHNRVKCTVLDLNFLKDHNNWLGEPHGGDYALRVLSMKAQTVADQFGAVLIRPHEAGGDDFILLEFPDDIDAQDRDLGKMLNDSLASISTDEYFSGKIQNFEIRRFDDSCKIDLDPEDILKLKIDSDLMKIIIPPSVIIDTFEINPVDDVAGLATARSHTQVMDYRNVASKLKQSMSRIKDIKKQIFQGMLKNNPAAKKLERSPKVYV